MKTNRIIAMILAICCVMSVLFTIPAFAAEDSFPYSFKLKADLGKSYSSDSYKRTTQYTDNPWKVNMTFNSEGEGAAAIYWIASSIVHTQYSDTHTIKQDSGNHYYKAYEEASGEYVKLGAKNNNNVSSAYDVSGYWDEEIGYRMSDLS